jgi:hypothetical protein
VQASLKHDMMACALGPEVGIVSSPFGGDPGFADGYYGNVQFNGLSDVVANTEGFVVADRLNHRIRQITSATGNSNS